MNAAVHFLISYWVKHRLTRNSDRDLARNGERGATAVEYTLLVTMIALVIILAVGALGQEIIGLFQPVVTALGG